VPLEVEDIKLYSVNELSELLGVTEVTLRGYIKTGRLKAQKLGGKWHVTNENLKEFLSGRYGGPKPEGKKRISLEGMFSDGKITEEDLEEVKRIWQAKTLP